ncbi:hypothetical protein R3W88_022952 [Solanum pinnatisectum]|uniref:Uncharacterized protein n=1 Tax=Solanum pinnatisectum TaxID=50273 RepID=A0AAV9LZE3_9SOLN|nr:hypothetical protein R3W88_022952 [Solanum pinnatisectum]
MEKGKNIEMELTEEDLRRKLNRFKQEIQETRKREMEVEIATAIARVVNAAPDEELPAKMARYAIMNEETATMRKEHDVFNKDITVRLQKIDEKCFFFDKKDNSGPKDTHLGALAEHPYFTRSKGPTDSFPGQSSRKGKSTMGDNVEDTGLTDVVVAQPVVADQNELIVQLMQQITEMRVEMQRRQDLPNPAFTAPADGRPPLHFPPSSAEQAHNPPSRPTHNPAVIDLTTEKPHYASSSYQTPPPPQNTNFHMPLPPQNTNLQTGPPPQTQNVNHPQTSLRHQNHHTNPRLTLKITKPL